MKVFVDDEIKICINPACSLVANQNEAVRVDANDINYNSPEFIETNKISLKYDIWSCGWLLFHMATLENPFDYLLEPANFTKLCLPMQYSSNLRALFKKMIELNPDDRFTCAELLEDSLFDKFKFHFDKHIPVS